MHSWQVEDIHACKKKIGTMHAQGEIQALSDPMIRRLDGMMQKKWDLRIPSNDNFLFMALNYESMQHDQWDPRGKTTFHLQESIDV